MHLNFMFWWLNKYIPSKNRKRKYIHKDIFILNQTLKKLYENKTTIINPTDLLLNVSNYFPAKIWNVSLKELTFICLLVLIVKWETKYPTSGLTLHRLHEHSQVTMMKPIMMKQIFSMTDCIQNTQYWCTCENCEKISTTLECVFC